ncbi:MAG: PadR family transcriptional regulator, partial [Spirochaetia bacterium]|nr:PadR family transcriptional regulator [Spirochaetia bacterium]
EGLVTSGWEQGGQGPRRRVYEITVAGRVDLDQWVKILKTRKSRIEALVGAYDQKAR